MILWYSGQFGSKNGYGLKQRLHIYTIKRDCYGSGDPQIPSAHALSLKRCLWWKMRMTTGLVEVHSLSRCLVYYNSIQLTIFKLTKAQSDGDGRF